MQRPTGIRRFALTVASLAALTAIIWFIDNKLSDQQGENNSYPPIDYYSYQPAKKGTIACDDPKTGSVLMGIADIYDLPANTAKEDILVISNAVIKIEDVTKSTEEIGKLAEALQPHILFHFERLDGSRARVSIYLRRDNLWYDILRFWVSRFNKEWQIMEVKIYDNKNVDGAGTKILEKVYKMNCWLLFP